MPRKKPADLDLGTAALDIATTAGKSFLRGLAGILAIGLGSALIGGALGGGAALYYSLPVFFSMLVGAGVLVVLVYGAMLVAHMDF